MGGLLYGLARSQVRSTNFAERRWCLSGLQNSNLPLKISKVNLLDDACYITLTTSAALFHKAKLEVGRNIKSQTAEHVISYSSRRLSQAEQYYSQIKRSFGNNL